MIISKPMFRDVVSHCDCGTFIHPWNPTSCTESAVSVMWESWIATTKFFTAVSLIQLCLRGKKDGRKIFQSLIGASINGAYASWSFIAFNCIFRKLFGMFNYYTVGLVSGTISGLGIFAESPSRKKLLLDTYLNMVLEIGARRLQAKGYLPNNRSIGLLLTFMMLNGAFFYKYLRSPSRNILWFFLPPKLERGNGQDNVDQRICNHKGTCVNDVSKSAGCYFLLGLGLQILKDLVFNHTIRRPNRKALQLAISVGSYVGIYKAVVCFLRQKFGKYSSTYALPAGFLSGISFVLYPKLNILLALFGNILQMFAREIKDMYGLPALPYKEVTFALCTGILYHHRVLHSDMCPRFFIFVIETMTNDKAALIYANLKRACEEATR